MPSHWHTVLTKLVVLQKIEEISIVILHRSAPHRSAHCLDAIEEATFGWAFRRGQETRAEQRLASLIEETISDLS